MAQQELHGLNLSDLSKLITALLLVSGFSYLHGYWAYLLGNNWLNFVGFNDLIFASIFPLLTIMSFTWGSLVLSPFLLAALFFLMDKFGDRNWETTSILSKNFYYSSRSGWKAVNTLFIVLILLFYTGLVYLFFSVDLDFVAISLIAILILSPVSQKLIPQAPMALRLLVLATLCITPSASFYQGKKDVKDTVDAAVPGGEMRLVLDDRADTHKDKDSYSKEWDLSNRLHNVSDQIIFIGKLGDHLIFLDKASSNFRSRDKYYHITVASGRGAELVQFKRKPPSES